MSIYQCQVCGCAENTALGWYHCRHMENLNKPEDLGIAKCSACAPTEYPSGEKHKEFNGEWHGEYKRNFLPHGEFFINEVGNLEHLHTGLIGNKAYEEFGRDTMYPKEMDVYPPCINPRAKKAAKANRPSKGRIKKDKQKARRSSNGQTRVFWNLK